MYHPNAVSERTVFEPEWFCTDYAAAELTLCETLAKRVEAIARESAHDGGDGGEQDAEAREEARNSQSGAD